MMAWRVPWVLCGASTLSTLAQAQTSAPAPAALTSQLVSLALGLALVLAIIGATAWLLKRLAPRTYGGSGALRVVGAVAVGQRERVVIVEVGGTWLVVGVAPGNVRAIHQMPKGTEAVLNAARSSSASPFAKWLADVMDKRLNRKQPEN